MLFDEFVPGVLTTGADNRSDSPVAVSTNLKKRSALIAKSATKRLPEITDSEINEKAAVVAREEIMIVTVIVTIQVRAPMSH